MLHFHIVYLLYKVHYVISMHLEFVEFVCFLLKNKFLQKKKKKNNNNNKRTLNKFIYF